MARVVAVRAAARYAHGHGDRHPVNFIEGGETSGRRRVAPEKIPPFSIGEATPFFNKAQLLHCYPVKSFCTPLPPHTQTLFIGESDFATLSKILFRQAYEIGLGVNDEKQHKEELFQFFGYSLFEQLQSGTTLVVVKAGVVEPYVVFNENEQE